MFGYNEIVGRTACAAVGVLSILIIYFLAKEVESEQAGLLAAFLTAVNYIHIEYSQELRFYSMTFFLTTLSYLFFVFAVKRGHFFHFVFYAVSTIALLYTHYYGIVVYALQALTFLYLVIFYKSDKTFVIRGLASGLVILIGFLPWIPTIINDLGIKTFWIQKPRPYFIFEYLYGYFGKDILTTTFLLICSFIFFKSIRKADKQQKQVYIALVIWLIGSYLIPYIKSLLDIPILHIRYTLITLPVWLVIFSIGITKIPNYSLKKIFTIVLFLSAIINLVFIRKYYTKIYKQQFREATAFVKDQNTQYPVVSQFPWHFNFYFNSCSEKVYDINAFNFSNIKCFWVLHVEFFNAQEREQYAEKFEKDFELIQSSPYYKTEALLFCRRPKSPKSKVLNSQ